MKLKSALNFSHELLKDSTVPGDIVIDGTAGKGSDTAYLAELVGKSGHVYSFDIQDEAIKDTNEKLTKNGLSEQVSVIQDGHENVAKYIHDDEISAAIFNLGYLPSGDKSIITKPVTTLTAVKTIMNNLAVNGLIILVLYYGHPGGELEKDSVLKFAEGLDQHEYNVLKYQFINQINNPPILLAIQKRPH